MRPLRAMGLAAAFVAAWGATRVGVIEGDLARYREGRAPGAEGPVRVPAALPLPEAAPERDAGSAPLIALAPERDRAAVRAAVPAGGPKVGRAAGPVPSAVPVAARPVQLAAVNRGGGFVPAAVPGAGSGEVRAAPTRIAFAAPGGRRAPATAALAGAAFASAERGYAHLAAGDRLRAARAFAAALSAAPAHPSAALWAAERQRLARRWEVGAYSLLREGGADGFGARPVLGGGQSGAAIGFTPNPLAARPVALQARINIAHDGLAGFAGDTAQGAVGISWRPLGSPALTLAAERLVAIGGQARDDWTVRASGGGAGRLIGLEWAAFGEAGAVGERSFDLYAGAQATAHRPLRAVGGVRLAAGGGVWGGWQQGFNDVSRLDAGPSMRLSTARVPVSVQLDYRFRLTGDADPPSGVALTLATQF